LRLILQRNFCFGHHRRVSVSVVACPRFEPVFDKFLSLGGRLEKISQICVVWGKAVAVSRLESADGEKLAIRKNTCCVPMSTFAPRIGKLVESKDFSLFPRESHRSDDAFRQTVECGPITSQMVTIGECWYRWLRLPATKRNL
jgi:hypothetical protein